MSWRGSWLEHMGIPVLPTIHPAAILRNWSDRFLALKDLQRVGRALKEGVPQRPKWRFYIRPSFDQVIHRLRAILSAATNRHESFLPYRIACDIETRRGQIACVGSGWQGIAGLEAICIPFMCVEGNGSYWSEREEVAIILALRDVLTHPQVRSTFHNGAYDCQYFAHQWGFAPARIDDTMIMQHVAFAGLRKSLAVCSSLYCNWHRYWKDDGKTWTSESEEQLWSYNCEDVVRTWEVQDALVRILTYQGQMEQYEFQMADLWPEVFRAMLRGVRIDHAHRATLDTRLEVNMEACLAFLELSLGHPFNPRSAPAMQKLLYEDFQIPVIRSRKTKQPTCDDEALDWIRGKYPLLRPLLDCISDFRSLGVFLGTFVRAPLSPDGRMRCTYNLAGAETYRFSSSEDAFGCGTNLQNISAGDE
jgi:DNA polymerase I-like protein with 3'-5' exonuclease and polymerase domains